jgi:hypothetical protein
MSDRVENPLENAHTNLDQLRVGGAKIHSPLHLLDLLLTGKNPNIRRTIIETEDDEVALQKKQVYFESALSSVYGEIIVAATKRFGIEFVARASEGDLTRKEVANSYNHDDEVLHQIVMNVGSARG